MIRGNSASGKSATAAAIRDRRGRRDLAIVGQDNLRRVVLREHDVPGGASTDLIDQTAHFAISHDATRLWRASSTPAITARCSPP